MLKIDEFYNLTNRSASMLNGAILFPGNKYFLPKELSTASVKGENFSYIGLYGFRDLDGNAVGFGKEHALRAAFGEIFERYCSQIPVDPTYYGSFNGLSKDFNIINPAKFNNFDQSVFEDKKIEIDRVTPNTDMYWVQGFDHISGKNILVPEQVAGFSNFSNGRYFYSTTTGMAAGANIEHAKATALLESIERHGFSQFWYLQKEIEFKKHSSQMILDHYPESRRIKAIYDNKRVKHTIFDLTEFTYVPTYFVFVEYHYKGKYEYSLGCASRFCQKEALIKAGLEAYQGIGYGNILKERFKSEYKPLKKMDLKKTINQFNKHFWFYHAYPSQRKLIPIFNQLKDDNFTPVKDHSNLPIKDFDSFREHSGVENLIVIDFSERQAVELGYYVCRVLTPDLILLTGNHAIPYTNYELFKGRNLFLEMPHFFP